jgi:hypothetical protein
MSAEYLAAQLEVATDTLVFICARRRDLSALPEWERWRPPEPDVLVNAER